MLARGATGSAVLGKSNQKPIVFKTADLLVHGNLGDRLDKEVRIYLGLKASDMALAPEYQIESVVTFHTVRYKMLENGAKNALSAFHAAGFIHGDVRLQNFCVIDEELGGVQVRIIDFERAELIEGRHHVVTKEKEELEKLFNEFVFVAFA
ncbi:hypothetical protein BCR33DRAFT_784435 [Rhizoclosmatium globosum]|uniref:Uncharacterized protein n=1 Tax=Rhizoclosmatium globosum TaxID=329046 RepID=A0A1Y2CF56_9FUNG|nr:hypothetical protein BCR33DRAFT_784435 [Rhizoclosmatium globosum]|eukprot:ORY45693.1 hypothetical protein BCR33DRAFT_784435 [Rhizoclosmatium globosum]